MKAPYLWKTETQLRAPESHLAWYFLKSGFTDSRNGPMKGAFHAGPAIEPLRQMYMTAQVSGGWRIRENFRTLIIGDRKHQDGEEESPDAEAIEDGREEAVGVKLCDHVGDFGIGRWRDKARVDCHVDSTLVKGSAREMTRCRRRRGGRGARGTSNRRLEDSRPDDRVVKTVDRPGAGHVREKGTSFNCTVESRQGLATER